MVEALEGRILLDSGPLDPTPLGATPAAEVTQILDPVPINTSTGDKPQSKVWRHDNNWWTVLANGTGTYVWRLDGSSWTSVLKLTNTNSYRADVKVVGKVAHVLLFNLVAPKLASIEYVPGASGASGTYQMWSGRSALASVPSGAGVLAATIDIDCTGRMWLATDTGVDRIDVRYSDLPYTSWSDPITLASNITDNDISVVTALPDCTVGVLWSNQSTKRFGFRVHVDGADPADWSADEVPAAASALDVNHGMADGHLNVAVTSDGTLYASVKTGYNRKGLPLVALLVRRPLGVWDPLYNVDDTGTRPAVMVSETAGLVRVIYTATGRPSEIVYRESSLSAIDFGPRNTLICGAFSDVSGSKQTFIDEMLVIAAGGGSVVSALRKPGSVQNQPPLVIAGPSQKITTLSTFLDGIVCDDGFPTGDLPLTTNWSVASGPGVVSFGDSAAVDTTAIFSRSGNYVLRLTASDGELSRSNDVSITIPNQAPLVNAGPDQTVGRNATVTLDATVSDDSFPDPVHPVTTTWSVVSGPGPAAIGNVTAVHTTATFSTTGAYMLRLTASDGEFTTTDDVTFTVGPVTSVVTVTDSFQDGVSGGTSYTGTQDTLITVATPGKTFGTATTLTGDGQADSAVLLRWDTSSIPAGAIVQSASISLVIQDQSAARYSIYDLKKDWSEASATWDSYSLSGKWEVPGAQGAGDRGSTPLGSVPAKSKDEVSIPLNAAGVATVQSWISNPGTNYGVTIQNYSDGADNVILFSSETSSAKKRPKLSVTYKRDNYEPELSAGADQTIDVNVGAPLTAPLDGTLTDDALPKPPGKVTATWTKVSGPGLVTFADLTAVDTTATFGTTGTYVLRLTASDGVLTNADDITITVRMTGSFQDGMFPTPTYDGTRDTWIDSLNPNATQGSALKLNVDGSPQSSALLKWDISSIPRGADVQAAAITLNVTNTTSDTYELYQVNQDWDELSATWNVRSSSASWEIHGLQGDADRGSTIVATMTPKTLGLMTIPLNASGLAAVQSWIDNPSSNFGIVIQDYTNATGQFVVSSREMATPANRTKLSLTFVEHQAPTANAGLDQAVSPDSVVALDGTVTDPGRLDPTPPVSTTWSVVSGPGTVTFGNSEAVDTSATFSETGVYVLRLTANDGRIATSDDVTITVTLSQAFQDGMVPAPSYRGTRDTAITDPSPSKGLGTAATLTVDGTKISTAMLKWDISSIPAGSVVKTASITLSITDPSLASFDVFEMKRDWSETLATWHAFSPTGKWQVAGAKGSSDRGSRPLASLMASNKGSVTVALNSTGVALIQSWVNNPAANFGIIIQNFKSKDALAFRSREASTPRDRPNLTVSYASGPPVPGAPALMLAGDAKTPSSQPGEGSVLSDAMAPVLAEAKARWAAAGLPAGFMDRLSNVHVEIRDLPGTYLALTGSDVIYLDRDAAGYGWSVHADNTGTASGAVDLLTAVAHEIGHLLGLGHTEAHGDAHGLMDATLDPGVRRVPTAHEVDSLLAGHGTIDLVLHY